MEQYPFLKIEEKWQKVWEEQKLFKAAADKNKKKYYILEMFPFTSGHLHMGHMRAYCIGDVLAYYYRMKGFNVLHPMGFDAFGLPAENAAIENKIHPAEWTYKNIEYAKKEFSQMGLSYDWDREVITCDESYYRWTQWLFLKFYEKGLVYKKKDVVNWCDLCGTVLANEQVEDGLCWRCESSVQQQEREGWFFKITDYSDKLLEGHKELNGKWPERILLMQQNWIGKSYGVEIEFKIDNSGKSIKIYTTRPDTIFGVTYMVFSPHHPMLNEIITSVEIREKLENMRKLDKTVQTSVQKEKEGFFTGVYAINPVNNEKVQIWVSPYVLMEYGTGAVMAVPAHDQRDFEFAKKHKLPVRVVINPYKDNLNPENMGAAYAEEGIMVNSGKYNGMKSPEFKEKIAQWFEDNKIGTRKTHFRLKDWSISRQRFWGEPIPIIYCDDCGAVPVPEEDLPVKLPEVIKFDKKVSTLNAYEQFVNTKCPKCGSPAKRETDTMDCFVASSWYFAKYADPKSEKQIFSKEEADYWMPVDQYIGGPEHACKHLIYARFFNYVMKDLKLLSYSEPFSKLLTQGIVYMDGAKMSKSKGNVVSVESFVEKYGADTGRMFVLFAAPPETDLEWTDKGVQGVYRFLGRVWRIVENNQELLKDSSYKTKKINPDNLYKEAKALRRLLHFAIKKVTEDIEKHHHFNTAISSLMELLNAVYVFEIPKDDRKDQAVLVLQEVINNLVKLLVPFAPHISCELWEKLGNKSYALSESWPEYDEKALEKEEVSIVVQVDGRLRGQVSISANSDENYIKEKCVQDEKVKKFIAGKTIKKIIVIPNKVVNIVTQ